MHLKKLEMLGFKSFADRTELSFQPGMTCIVGPNGCGKSNVVDAFKWIFGEQSAKGMRGSEMKDVIFNGTMERKPTGFAEVTILFENSDRFLDVDYAEVAITRRLFRSGESEYLINKQRCRLKDIREMFMGTGVGQTSYSILEQGKIDALLQANHVERRFIFEEAAGISKYLSKKAETVRALLRVDENLTRLNDIIAEVEKRLARVKAQASKARRYRELSERLKDLRVRSALEDYRDSVLARADISFRLHFSEFHLSLLDRAQQALNEAGDRKSALRNVHESEMSSIRDRLAGERMKAERTRERLEQEERRVTELAAERERKADEIAAAGSSVRQLFERIEMERREAEDRGRDLEGQRLGFQSLQTELEGARRRRERLESELSESKNAVVALLQERSRLSSTLSQLEAEESTLRARMERLRGTLENFRGQIASEEAREGELHVAAARERAECERLQALRALDDALAASLLASLEGLEKTLESRVALLLGHKSRYSILKDLEEKLEGVSRGVQGILRRRHEAAEISGLAGLHGMVASLVKVERKYSRAVEAALGARAQALVVESQDGALSLLDVARQDNGGAVEVISLDRVDCIPPERFPRQAGVLGPLVDRVEVPQELEDLFRRLLANVVLVEDFDTALALSRNGLRPFRLVTLEGEVIEPWGALVTAGKSDLGLISRRSEMEELARSVSALELETSVLRTEQASLKQRQGEKRQELETTRQALEQIARSIVQIESSVAHAAREKDRLLRECALGEAETGEIAAELAARAVERAAVGEKLSVLDIDRSTVEGRVATLEANSMEAAEAEGIAQDVLTQARVELVQLEKRLEGLREMISRDASSLEERQAATDALHEEARHLATRQEEACRAVEENNRELKEVAVRVEAVSRELEAAEGKGNQLKEAEQTLRREGDVVRQEAARVAKERESAQLRDQEEKHRRNSILERMNEEYGLDLVTLVESEGELAQPSLPAGENPAPPLPESLVSAVKYLQPDPTWDRDRARDEVREIQEKLRRMGSVNLEALDELEELEQRYDFQQAQRNDLMESSRSLQGIIAEINKTSRDLFLKTFEEVQIHFSDLFRKCFGGGKAELVLEPGLDVLEAGIDIVAKPPGKKITSLSLMSGGEKTMTTIALLFAIFRAKPGPFCILDEVDAPLDETNVRRFAVLLKDFIANTQFVVVSHNKVTMAEANTLYGITMQEHGVSKRVAVELESYDEAQMQGASVN